MRTHVRSDYWLDKCRGRQMPSRRDIDPTEILRPLLPGICPVDAVADERRYVCRLVGTGDVAVHGCGPTGKSVIEGFFGASAENVLASYDRVVATRAPFVDPTHFWAPTGRYVTEETIFLPQCRVEIRVGDTKHLAEATARHLSMTKAADELRVTQVAISYHVRMLEDCLGTSLLNRRPRGVKLTLAGTSLLPVLEDSFDKISSTLEAIRTNSTHNGITVTTTPTFALRWLVPRLLDFRGRHQNGPEVHLRPTLRLLDIVHGEADIAIRCGTPPWAGLRAELLMKVTISPVCSPDLLRGSSEPMKPADLLNAPLLHADIPTIPLGNDWRIWFEAAGVPCKPNLPGRSFEEPSVTFQSAISGEGFAMGYLEMLADELASGRLVCPVDLKVEHPLAYYVVYAPARQSDVGIAAFRRWLLDEASLGERETRHIASPDTGIPAAEPALSGLPRE